MRRLVEVSALPHHRVYLQVQGLGVESRSLILECRNNGD
jgi:hypothetical protein